VLALKNLFSLLASSLGLCRTLRGLFSSLSLLFSSALLSPLLPRNFARLSGLSMDLPDLAPEYAPDTSVPLQALAADEDEDRSRDPEIELEDEDFHESSTAQLPNLRTQFSQLPLQFAAATTLIGIILTIVPLALQLLTQLLFPTDTEAARLLNRTTSYNFSCQGEICGRFIAAAYSPTHSIESSWTTMGTVRCYQKVSVERVSLRANNLVRYIFEKGVPYIILQNPLRTSISSGA